jgi:hypothetical protein
MNGTITPTLTLLAALLLASQSVARAADELVVYPPVPGLAASEHYKVRVRSASDGREWQSAFAWKTVCKTIEKKTDAYFDTLAGWTHTYVNFETAGAVEIEIARVNGQRIRAAAVHPRRKASACSVKDGKVLVRLDKPCLVAVDIDGQMDAQNTGKGYKGPPIHTISLFANPPLGGKRASPKTVCKKDVVLLRQSFDVPPLKDGHRYRIRVGGSAHPNMGEGYAIYINGKLLAESRAGVVAWRREGGKARGGHVGADFRDEFKGGKVTLAVSNFPMNDKSGDKFIPAGAPLSVWMEEMKIPPLGHEPD